MAESAKAKHATVAVVGAGPTGLSMLKAMLEYGFDATLFERRPNVGGLWAYTDNKAWTTALRMTSANISKHTCGFTDYPMPDRYPSYMSWDLFQEFMQDYAKDNGLLDHIVFNASVIKAVRNDTDTKWRLEMEREGKPEAREFDKVVFCHGYQTKANMPVFEGAEKFEGSIIHAQQYRSNEEYRDKKVVIVGLSATTSDIGPDIAKTASKVYVSHRRGAIPFKRYRKGSPVDLQVSWRRRMMSQSVQKHFPGLATWLAGFTINYLVKKWFPDLKPEWRLSPFPNMLLTLGPAFGAEMIQAFEDGTITSLWGIKRILGPRSIEFMDGTILDDIDAIVCCTGYSADFSVAPELETSRPKDPQYFGADLYRLYMNLFPPKYADSFAMVCHSAYGKNNGFSFSDVISWAVCNVFSGIEKLPSQAEMNRHIDAHQEWIASRYRLEPKISTSMIKQWEWQGWLHRAAGTGMENLGWGWKGWKFWWKDREMYKLMNDGIETAHAFRFFETGKRPAWDGAREAIIHANQQVKLLYPSKDPDKQ